MKLKWSKAELKYFAKPIPTVERKSNWIIWLADLLLGKKYSWIIWATIAICSWAGLGYFIWWVVIR